MEFKLVRTDTPEPCKINLPVGKHIIGRGNFIINDADDMRVSRNHAEIEVTDDCVILTSLHQNPCYYIDKTSKTKQLLTQNKSQLLCNGDKFGILPDTYWYEVIWCTLNTQNNNETNVNDEVEQVVNETEPVSKSTEECDENPTNTTEEKDAATQTLDEPSLDQHSNSPQSPQDKNNGKRSLSAEDSNTNEEVKRIKTDDTESTVKTETVDSAAQAGPSGDHNVSDQNDKGKQDTAQGSNDGAQGAVKPPRERCMYGADCYRRNPQHAATYSHPGDQDWTQPADCRYGARCTRRDPRHRRDYLHPAPAPQQLAGMQLVQRHGNTFYINAHSVNFYDDHFQVEDSDGDSVDYDYEF